MILNSPTYSNRSPHRYIPYLNCHVKNRALATPEIPHTEPILLPWNRMIFLRVQFLRVFGAHIIIIPAVAPEAVASASAPASAVAVAPAVAPAAPPVAVSAPRASNPATAP